MEELKRDVERAEAYFWRQTPERRRARGNYLDSRRGFGGNDFIFGNRKPL
jgi:hypothetical protein